MMRWGLCALLPMVLALAPLAQAGEPLSIPCGYFDGSGGYHSLGCDAPCWRYAPAGGCTVPLHYAGERPRVFPPSAGGQAARSWYAAAMPGYPAGPRCAQPGCPFVSAPTEPVASEAIGPGLIVEP